MRAIFFLLLTLVVGCAYQPKVPTFNDFKGLAAATIIFEAPNLQNEKTLLGTFPQEANASVYNACDKHYIGFSSGILGEILLSSDQSIGKRKEIKVKSNETLFIEFGVDNDYFYGVERFAFIPEPHAKYLFQFYSNGYKYRVTEAKLELDENGNEMPKPIDFIHNSSSDTWGFGSWKKCSEN